MDESAVQNLMKNISGLPGMAKENLEKIADMFRNATNATEKTSNAIGVMNMALTKATTNYNNLAQYGDRFSGMASQINELSKQADGGLSALTKLGIVTRKQGEADGTFITRATEFISKTAGKADVILQIESAYMKAAAATGELGKVMDATGQNFEDISKLTMIQGQLMVDTGKATNKGQDAIASYYGTLSKIPGVLTEVVKSASGAANGISMFAAAIQVADGSGRSADDIGEDLKKAYSAYALKADDALNFSVKLAEAQRNNGVTMDVFKSAIHSTADAFKGFADTGGAANKMAEGGINIFNNYIDGLKKTGTSAEEATRMVQGMTNQIKEMGLGQKAFLSAQTGGPGGLMGAFQIDKMLKDGDIEGVFKKVRDQMQKQLGPIVTLDDATNSPAAAAQLVKQKTMLMSGPLGGMAKTDTDAYRILESMKTGTPPPRALTDTVQKAMQRGKSIEARSSLDVISNIRDTLAQSDLLGGMQALKAMQASLGGAISFGKPSTAQQERMYKMGEQRSAAADRTGAGTTSITNAFNEGSTGNLDDHASKGMSANIKDMLPILGSIKNVSLKKIKDHLIGLIDVDKSYQEISEAYDDLVKKAGSSGISDTDKTAIKQSGRTLSLSSVPKESRELFDQMSEEQATNAILQEAELSSSDGIKKTANKSTSARSANQPSGKVGSHTNQSDGHEYHLKITAICEECRNTLLSEHVHPTVGNR